MDETIAAPKKRKTQGQDFRTAVEASAEAERRAREEANPPKVVMLPLTVKLTDVEIQARGLELVAAISKEKILRAKKKAAADHFKAQIELSHQAQDDLASVIADGFEVRAVECVETFYFPTNTVTTARADTGEIVSTRAMTRNERQPDLPGVSTDATEPDDDGEFIDDPATLLANDDGSAE